MVTWFTTISIHCRVGLRELISKGERFRTIMNSCLSISAAVLLSGSVLAFLTYIREVRCGTRKEQPKQPTDEELIMFNEIQ